MNCQRCGMQIQEGWSYCQNCGEPVRKDANAMYPRTQQTPPTGLATLRIQSTKYRHPFFMVMNLTTPWTWGYKVYIHVDDKEYILKSKNGMLEIPVVPGEHWLHVSAAHHNLTTENNLRKAAGFTEEVAAIGGFTNVAAVSHIVRTTTIDLSDYTKEYFAPNELKVIRVKMNIHGKLVEL